MFQCELQQGDFCGRRQFSCCGPTSCQMYNVFMRQWVSCPKSAPHAACVCLGGVYSAYSAANSPVNRGKNTWTTAIMLIITSYGLCMVNAQVLTEMQNMNLITENAQTQMSVEKCVSVNTDYKHKLLNAHPAFSFVLIGKCTSKPNVMWSITGTFLPFSECSTSSNSLSEW